MARHIAQTCPCRAVAPPSGGTQRDFGAGKTLASPKLRRSWEQSPLEGAPGTVAAHSLEPKRRAWKRCWSFRKASGCTKCEETTPNPYLVLAEKRTHEVHTLFWREACIQ